MNPGLNKIADQGLSTEAISSSLGEGRKSELEKAARDFEAFFTSQIFNSMAQSGVESEFWGDSREQGIFQSMFIDEVSMSGSKAGKGLGLAETLLKQMENRISPDALRQELDSIERSPVMQKDEKEMKLSASMEVSSQFGFRKDPITGQERHHNGVDLAVPMGTPVKAAKDGVVTFSGYQGDYGRTITIDHGDGITTRYAHHQQNKVQEGQKVKEGEIIGVSGSSGRSTGPHLHFEVRKGDEPVDPKKYVKFDKII